MLTDWTQDLPELPSDQLASIFPDAAIGRDAVAKLDKGKTFRRQVDRRRMITLGKLHHAVEAIGKLPRRRESIHAVMTSHYDGWTIVPAVLQLAKCKIRRLNVATLGFSREHTNELFQMFDDGRIGAVDFVCSSYFRSVDVDLFEHLRSGLANRGQQCAVVRSHAKLLCFEMANGKSYVWESSANLRSCRNAETFVLSQDPELLAFHREWLLELITKTERNGLK